MPVSQHGISPPHVVTVGLLVVVVEMLPARLKPRWLIQPTHRLSRNRLRERPDDGHVE